MANTLVIEEQIEIPMSLGSLADFRAWATSDAFPERGRIDYIGGRIEVDMSPEDLFCHGALKVELIRVLSQRVKSGNLGHLFTDRTRVSAPDADLSTEPDLVFVSHASLTEGRARLVAKSTAEPGRYVEIEGAPDMIVEIVSDASVSKDTRRLPEAYFRAGAGELWLADARGEELVFQIHHRGESAFEPVAPDADGFQCSHAFACRFRLDGTRDEQGAWRFDLLEKEAASGA
jgi:Uma2 family endonuclease